MEKQLPDRVAKLFLIFKQAVEDERRAQKMYQEALALCDDELTKTALQELYRDEVRHELQLVERYSALRREFGVD